MMKQINIRECQQNVFLCENEKKENRSKLELLRMQGNSLNGFTQFEQKYEHKY